VNKLDTDDITALQLANARGISEIVADMLQKAMDEVGDHGC